jgi:CrcB protein
LHGRRLISNDVNTLIGTGIMGGLSTFSSFVYGSAVLIATSVASAVVALVYLLVSLVFGYLAVVVGQRLGGKTRA